MLRDGFAYEMLIAHEQQHNETMLQLLQMVDGYEPPLVAPPAAPASQAAPTRSRSGAGTLDIGASGRVRLRQRAAAPRGSNRRRS